MVKYKYKDVCSRMSIIAMSNKVFKSLHAQQLRKKKQYQYVFASMSINREKVIPREDR